MKDTRAGKLQMIQIRGCETPPNIHTFKKKKIVTKISPVLESSLMLPVSLIKFPVFWLGAAKTGLPAEACHPLPSLMCVQLDGYGKQLYPDVRQVSSLVLRHTGADP